MALNSSVILAFDVDLYLYVVRAHVVIEVRNYRRALRSTGRLSPRVCKNASPKLKCARVR